MADKGGAPAGEEKCTTVQIKVKNAKNLRGVKGDSVTAYVRVEFGKLLGETSRYAHYIYARFIEDLS